VLYLIDQRSVGDYVSLQSLVELVTNYMTSAA
jgi:hypothetical protein